MNKFLILVTLISSSLLIEAQDSKSTLSDKKTCAIQLNVDKGRTVEYEIEKKLCAKGDALYIRALKDKDFNVIYHDIVFSSAARICNFNKSVSSISVNYMQIVICEYSGNVLSLAASDELLGRVGIK
tara:strand:- start:124 stop:504 length:381 start_codon:yes stop_codon:yes gene_type:complete